MTFKYVVTHLYACISHYGWCCSAKKGESPVYILAPLYKDSTWERVFLWVNLDILSSLQVNPNHRVWHIRLKEPDLLMCHITKSICIISMLTEKNSNYNLTFHKTCSEWENGGKADHSENCISPYKTWFDALIVCILLS